MNQLLQDISNPSLQNLSAIVAIITGILGFLQFGQAKNDIHIFMHHISSHTASKESQHSTFLGFIGRCILYFVCFISIFFWIVPIPPTAPSSPPASSLSLTDNAKTMIQAFYDDVNGKDYQDAFNMTKDGFGSDYKTFVDGYHSTKHDDISFNEIKELTNGNVQVTITIRATEDCSTGERISDYYERYTLGQDHGVFLILEGHYTQTPLYPPCP